MVVVPGLGPVGTSAENISPIVVVVDDVSDGPMKFPEGHKRRPGYSRVWVLFVHRFTLNFHGLKIMMEESFP